MNYQKIYDDLISRAKQENRKKVKGGTYYENHHIIPVCLGGLNDKDNLVLLTAREHFVAHKLLAEIYPNNNKLIYGFRVFLVFNKLGREDEYRITSREFERMRVDYSKVVSETHKGKKISDSQKLLISVKGKGRLHSDTTKSKMSESKKGWVGMVGENNHMFGKSHTDETKRLISIKNLGRKLTKQTKSKISDALKNVYKNNPELKEKCAHRGVNNPFFGKNLSEETRNKISKSLIGKTQTESSNIKRSKTLMGRIISEEARIKIGKASKGRLMSEEAKNKMSNGHKKTPLVTCPHCGLTSKKGSNMVRYHFDNCKYKPK